MGAKLRLRLLKSIFDAVLLSMAHRKGPNNISLVTGPILWRKILGDCSDDKIQVIDHDYIFSKVLRKNKFTLSGRDTDRHWSVRQKNESLYSSE